MSAAAVSKGTASVSVKQNFQRRIVLDMIVAPIELAAVKGGNCDRLKGNSFHDVADAADMLLKDLILRSFQGVIDGTPF